MELCSDNHEEICYEGRECPLCEVKDDLLREVERLTAKVENLEDQIANS